MMNSMTIGCISAVETSDSLLYNEEEFRICMLKPHIYLMMDGVAARQRAHINHILTAQEGISLSLSIWMKCVFFFLMCSSIQKKKKLAAKDRDGCLYYDDLVMRMHFLVLNQ